VLAASNIHIYTISKSPRAWMVPLTLISKRPRKR
jgi:hypothetical protein